MKKLFLPLLALLLAAVCALSLFLTGKTYTVKLPLADFSKEADLTADGIEVTDDSAGAYAELTEKTVEDGVLLLRYRGKAPGKAHVTASHNDSYRLFNVYVHPGNLITYGNFFGRMTGDIVIPIAATVFLAAVLGWLILRYRANVKNSIYRYRNVLELALILFTAFFTLTTLPMLISYEGLMQSVTHFTGSVSQLSGVLLPTAFVMSILITVSNVQLIRREGRNWRNLLGTFLGAALLVLTVFPALLGEFLQRADPNLIDVHNERGAALYIERFTESSISLFAAYLETVLIATVVTAVKAARHEPAYDKDYMLILGCQLMPDGALTPLLRSRADRAIAFAEKQKAETGKDLVFVPTGGQGADEVMPEGEAIKNYLLSCGVPEDRILAETASVNTEENIRLSMALIRAHAGTDAPKVAFATTNYHVFRAGLLAAEQGVRMEGVGGKTKRYFWLNAFIREFIATMVSQRKIHLAVLALLLAATGLSVLLQYLAVVL